MAKDEAGTAQEVESRPVQTLQSRPQQRGQVGGIGDGVAFAGQ